MRDSVTPQSPQHHLRRRLCRRPARLSWIDAFERGADLLNCAARRIASTPTRATRCSTGKPTRRPDDCTETVASGTRHDLSIAQSHVRSGTRCDRRRHPVQAQLLGGVIGRIDAPARAHGLCERRLLTHRGYAHALAVHCGRRARAVAPLDVLVHFGGHAGLHQLLNAMVRNDRGGSLGRGRFVRQALFALLAFIERVDLGDGVRRGGASASLGSRQRPASARPDGALATSGTVRIDRALCARPYVKPIATGSSVSSHTPSAGGNRISLGSEHVAQDGVEPRSSSASGILLGGEWAQVVVLVRHDLRARAEAAILQSPT